MPRTRTTPSLDQGKPDDPAAEAAHLKQQIHKGLVLHFMVQLSIVEDADERLAARSMGRVHHRVLYFAHFTPGITVSELLAVLGVKHQNIQGPLRELVAEGYIVSRASEQDGRVKQLYCSRKGDKLLEFVSGPQRDRFVQAYEQVSARDIQSYFKVMAFMLDDERRAWTTRLTEIDAPGDSI